MNILQLLKLTHGILFQNQIDHALIGGLALGVYGYERFTNDVDILLEADNAQLAKKVLISVGFELFHETKEVMQFVGIGHLDVLLASRIVSKTMLADAVFVDGLGIKCLLAEDIIGLKIQAYCNDSNRRLKDLADIQELLGKNDLDLVKIKNYADIFSEWPTISGLVSK